MGLRITVFGGAGEVGGNQILVEGKETKLLLDFGRNFSKESDFFSDPFLKARRLEQLLRLNLLPPIPGLYRGEGGEPPVDAILLSHAHLDHMDYVRYVRPDLPIFAGEGTLRIILAREVSSPRESSYRLAEFSETDEPLYRDISPTVPIQTFRSGQSFRVGEFEVTPIHVDHSIPASYGYLLEGPEGRMAYTGDLRFHGPRASMSEEFVQRIEGVDVLITEGTNLLESRPSSEQEVEQKVRGLVSACRGLVAASFSSVDVDRLRTFYRIAQSTGRELVISMRQACLMEVLRPEIEGRIIEGIFRVGDPGVSIYRRGKERWLNWELKLEDRFGTVDSSWVSQNQSRVLLFATYYDMLELLDVKPGPGSIYVYSESEPWDEEGEIEYGKLGNWLELLGMPMFHVHASGHASSLELKGMVERVGPKLVIPVHCGRPHLLKGFLGNGRIICPKWGESISLP
jgi:ribonuclease J